MPAGQRHPASSQAGQQASRPASQPASQAAVRSRDYRVPMFCRSLDPFKYEHGPYNVIIVPVLKDNYAYIVIDNTSGSAAAVGTHSIMAHQRSHPA